MILIKPTIPQIETAKRLAAEMGDLNNSITHGEGNVYGFLGELVVADYLGVPLCNTFDYDLIRNGKRLDVKTKHCTSMPLPEYECSVAAYNIEQQCDYYIFCRIIKDFSRGWILGWIAKDEFYKLATFYKGGVVDPKSLFGWTFKADCYNLEVGELKQF